MVQHAGSRSGGGGRENDIQKVTMNVSQHSLEIGELSRRHTINCRSNFRHHILHRADKGPAFRSGLNIIPCTCAHAQPNVILSGSLSSDSLIESTLHIPAVMSAPELSMGLSVADTILIHVLLSQRRVATNSGRIRGRRMRSIGHTFPLLRILPIITWCECMMVIPQGVAVAGSRI